MNAKPKKADEAHRGLNMMVFERFSARQERELMNSLYQRGYFEEDKPDWMDVLNGIQKGYIKANEYIKILTDRQLAQLYAPPTDNVKKMDWKPSHVKKEIRKHTKPLHDAWQEILSKEKKQWAILRAASELDVGIDRDAIPDKTQRDFMRELFMKHVDPDPLEDRPTVNQTQEKKIIFDYVAGERDGIVVRRSKTTGIKAAQYARNLFNDGLKKEWIYEFMPVHKESDDVIDRVTKAIEKSGLSIKQIGTRCGVTDKHVYNWRNTGQIARQFLLPFARVTNTEAHPVTVDWILGGKTKEKASEDASGTVPGDPHWFRRPMMNADDEMVTETTRLIPMLSAQQAMAWDTQTRDFWTKAPEQFASVPTIDWASNPGSMPAFAYQMDQEGFGPDIVNLDCILFSDDCLPRLGDFCMFRVWRTLSDEIFSEEEQRFYDPSEPTPSDNEPRLVMGYFYSIGGKPDTTSLETYWKNIKGISLTENKDGSKGRYDEEYRLSDRWRYELIGVAIEINRPLIGPRHMVLVRGETTTEDQFLDGFFARYSADEIAELIKESDGHQEIMAALEKTFYDDAADRHAEMQLNERRGK